MQTIQPGENFTRGLHDKKSVKSWQKLNSQLAAKACKERGQATYIGARCFTVWGLPLRMSSHESVPAELTVAEGFKSTSLKGFAGHGRR